MVNQAVYIPNQMAVFLLNAVGKPVDLIGLNLAVLSPAHNMATGGRANVDSQII